MGRSPYESGFLQGCWFLRNTSFTIDLPLYAATPAGRWFRPAEQVELAAPRHQSSCSIFGLLSSQPEVETLFDGLSLWPKALSHPTPTNSRRRWLVPILTVVIAIAVVYSIVYKRLWVHQNVHEPLQRVAAEMTTALKTNGLDVGQPELAQNIGGTQQVVALDVAGRSIRLLEFDVSNEAERQQVRRIRDTHSTKELGVDQPAEVEGAIAIIDFESHPAKKAILDAFHKSGSGGKH
jgi:hypothetical protein